MKLSIGKKAVILIVLILLIDQAVKILIKTSMTIGESKTVFDNWFFIKFIENPGMAFGLDIPVKFGKLFLSLFRIIAVILIGWYLKMIIQKQVKPGLIICLSLIFAGALGNIIDSVFYGLIFNESTYFTVASLFPEGGSYAPLLHGRVVYMLYFPIIKGTYPSWFPWSAGEEFIFFRPIFNIADSSISIGIITILIFQKRYFKHNKLLINVPQEPLLADKDTPLSHPEGAEN
jgi:signal peptidase II